MAMTGAFHGRDRFDPVLIVAQIVLLLASFYTSYLLLLVLFQRATGTPAPIVDQMFNFRRLTLSHFPGWITATALVLSMIAPTALAFIAVVGRAKRAADFAATLFVFHLVATTLHSGFPSSAMWWVLNLAATAGLATVAEAVSIRIELRDIPAPRVTSRDREREREREHDRDRDRDRDSMQKNQQLQHGPKRDIENPATNGNDASVSSSNTETHILVEQSPASSSQ